VEALDALRAAIPDVAKDIRLNVSAVMKGGALTEAQRWGVAVTTSARPTRRLWRTTYK
jgi:alkyl hydroperoxide reductase subunit D